MDTAQSVTEVRVFESEMHALVAETLRFPSIETGGDLFGLFTHARNPVIWLATPPGPRARRDRTTFQQDTSYVSDMQRISVNHES